MPIRSLLAQQHEDVLRSTSAKLGIAFGSAVHMACHRSHWELSAHFIISIKGSRALMDSRRQTKFKCFMCHALVTSEKLRASC